jgi:hypothetical protein
MSEKKGPLHCYVRVGWPVNGPLRIGDPLPGEHPPVGSPIIATPPVFYPERELANHADWLVKLEQQIKALEERVKQLEERE